jgi:hypothetical protein
VRHSTNSAAATTSITDSWLEAVIAEAYRRGPEHDRRDRGPLGIAAMMQPLSTNERVQLEGLASLRRARKKETLYTASSLIALFLVLPVAALLTLLWTTLVP